MTPADLDQWERAEALPQETLGRLLFEILFGAEPQLQRRAQALMARHIPAQTPQWLTQAVVGPGREGALRRVQSLGDGVLGPSLGWWLRHSQRWSQRKAAAWALGQLRSVVRLENAREAAHPDARAAAARGLGQCGPQAIESVGALVALAAGDGQWKVRQSAVVTLGRLKSSPEALLRSVAQDPHWEVRRSALWSLGRLGALVPKASIRLALKLEEHPDVLAASERLLGPGAVLDSQGTASAPVESVPLNPNGAQARVLAHGLVRKETVLATIERLKALETLPQGVVEGLCDLLEPERSLSGALEAASLLAGSEAKVASNALIDAAGHHPALSVRQESIRSLVRVPHEGLGDLLRRLFCLESAWLVRRTIVEAWFRGPESWRWLLFEAFDDPLWRVRHAAATFVIEWVRSEPDNVADVVARLDESQQSTPLYRATARYVRFHLTPAAQREGFLTRFPAPQSPSLPAYGAPWWDDDPAVLHLNLGALCKDDARRDVGLCVGLLDHSDDRVARAATNHLVKWGSTSMLAAVLEVFGDTRRRPGRVLKLLSMLTASRRAALAREVLAVRPSKGALLWALDHLLGVEVDDETRLLARALLEHPVEDIRSRAMGLVLHDLEGDEEVAEWQKARKGLSAQGLARCLGSLSLNALLVDLSWVSKKACGHVELRLALCRSLASAPHGVQTMAFWQDMARDGAWKVRKLAADWFNANAHSCPELFLLQEDHDHRVREAALTLDRAREVWAQPDLETSWRVLRAVARWVRRPLGDLVPSSKAISVSSLVSRDRAVLWPSEAPAGMRQLCPQGPWVTPMGVTGHYGLSAEGFAQAAEAGCNFFFWEPPYNGMTRFFRHIEPQRRSDLVVMSGSMGTTADELRRDIEHVLERLRLDVLPVFLIFWVRSSGRLRAPLMQDLEDLKAEGLIGTYGISTHQRSLALEALEQGWRLIMIRHNAAHRGVERQVLPAVLRHGAGLVSFSNLCYGRMLQRPHPQAPAPPSAADAYRYVLSQPGVSACLSAPETLAQLQHNLQVLRRPTMDAQAQQAMRRFGDEVYLHNQPFARYIRPR